MMNLLEEVDEDYDYIFLDMPPVLVVTDAAIIGSKVDGVVLVLASGEVSPEEARQAKSLLEKGKANILGTVLNKMPYIHRHSHYYYYYYDEDHIKHKHHK